MLKVDQLRKLIIKPALERLIMYSEDAMELLVFTCAVESEGGTYLAQVNGPALGIYQMEPATYNDIWDNYIKNKTSLMLMLTSNFDVIRMPNEDRLVYDLWFATAMCRIHYERVSSSLPSKDSIQSLWEYYKAHYNTPQGAAIESKSIEKYLAFIKS